MATKQIGLSHDLLIHPGETLREAIEDRGLNQKELALRTDFTEKHVSKILNGKSTISSRFALALETALGIDAVFWLNLQANYEIELASLEQISTVSDDEIRILPMFKNILPYLEEEGLIEKAKEKKEIVLQLRNFLGVKNLTVIPNLKLVAAFRASRSNSINPYIVFAWVRLCEEAVRKQPSVPQLNVELLLQNIPEIRSLTHADANTLQTVVTPVVKTAMRKNKATFR